jgi:hypothetical protein
LILLAIIGAGLMVNALIALFRSWLQDVQRLLQKQEDRLEAFDATITRLQKLADAMTEALAFYKEAIEEIPEPSPEPEPDPEPERPPIPSVIGLTDYEVWYILRYIATKGDGRFTRSVVVDDAGFSRGDCEKMRDGLRQQGYLEEFSVSGRPVAWTDKGDALLQAIRESDWEPSKPRWEVEVG